MTKIVSNTYTLTQEYSKYLTSLFLVGALFMAVLYGMNVYNIVSRTVAVKNLEKAMAKIQVHVQELDTEYIGLTGKITPDVAKHYGLHEGVVSAYIPKTPSLGRVALASEL